MATIRLKNILKQYITNDYTVKAVDNVDLDIKDNESLAIVGPSGSGKSTLINIIGLILNADKGEVYLDDKIINNLSDAKASKLRNSTFGYIVQDFALLNEESVYKNIRIPLIFNGNIKRSEHKERIHNAAKSLGIEDKLRRKAGKLSGGERQRVAIARAIVCDQPIILADEPTGSLDESNKENVVNILLSLCKEHNKTLIVVTHDMSVANKCDRIIKMKDGKIVQ